MAAPARPRWKPTKDEQADLDAMNTSVSRIQRQIPSDPYYLEIPQEASARHTIYPSQRYQWTRDTPFERNEPESLQYQTFHFYEPGKELFEQHSTRLEAPASNRAAIARAATPSTGPKTKISLAAYKKKQNAANSTPELNAQKVGDAPSKQAAVKGPVERAKAETEEMLASVAEAEQEISVAKKKEAQAPVSDLKRKRDEREQREKLEQRNANAPADDAEPAAKKARALGDRPVERPAVQNGPQRKPGAAAITKADLVSGTSKPDEHRLPPRLSPQLSPLLPDRLSPLADAQLAAMSLPPRLSPSMPTNILKTLESQNGVPSATNVPSKDKEASSNLTTKETDKVTKDKSPMPPRNGFRAGSSSPALRSEAENKLRSATSAPQQKSAVPSKDDEIVVAKAKKAQTEEICSDPPILQKPRLLLKLKYRKSQASAIKRILGLRTTPDKSLVAAPAQPVENLKPTPVEKRNGELKDGSGNVKGVAQKVGPAKKDKKAEKQPVAEKRPPTEKPSIPEKSPAAEKPSIPSPAKLPPPEKRSVAEKQPVKEKRPLPEDEKHDSPTKRKKLEAPAARKEPYTPSQQAVESPSGSKSQLQATPSARNNLLAVAMARDRSQDSNSTQTPPGTAITPTISNTSQPPNGTTRPPSSQPSSRTPKQQAWAGEAKHYEKLGKELKHTASAHLDNHLPNSPALMIDQQLAAVKSIESFLSFMLSFVCHDEAGPSRPEIKRWQSLIGFHGFVKRNTEHFPTLAGLTASLTVVFAARVLEIGTQYHRSEASARDFSREQMMDMQALLSKYSSEADAKLDVDILQDSFPKSWSQRTKKGLPARDKLEPKSFGGQYKLPIGLATSPVRAARAGCAILREWLDGEKIDYSLKLKLV